MEMICKDKMQAETWFVGLRAIISRTHHHRMVDPLKSNRCAHSCICSRVGYVRRKQNLGLSAKIIRPSQVESLKDYVKQERRKFKSQQKVEEAWSVAKEEASKSKAAKEVIKALTSRVTILFPGICMCLGKSSSSIESNLLWMTYMIGTVPEQFMGSLLLW